MYTYIYLIVFSTLMNIFVKVFMGFVVQIVMCVCAYMGHKWGRVWLTCIVRERERESVFLPPFVITWCIGPYLQFVTCNYKFRTGVIGWLDLLCIEEGPFTGPNPAPRPNLHYIFNTKGSPFAQVVQPLSDTRPLQCQCNDPSINIFVGSMSNLRSN